MGSKKMICEHCETEDVNSKNFMFQCRRCGAFLCLRCRLPETHLCPAVKWTFGDEPIKWYKHELTEYMMDAKTLEIKKMKQVSRKIYLGIQTGEGDYLTKG